MRNLPNHAKIQGISTTYSYSKVREGLLQMHQGDCSRAARTPLAELADPNADHTWRLNPSLLFGPAFLGPLWQARSRLCCTDSTEPVACAACRSDILDTSATQNAVSAVLQAAACARLVLWCVALFVCKLFMLVCTSVVLRVMRAVVCHNVATISTHPWSALANVNRKSQFATECVQRRVIACQITVYIDTFVSHDRVNHG